MTWSTGGVEKKTPYPERNPDNQTHKIEVRERERELLPDTNLATLTMITDFYKSNKHATRDLRAVVQNIFLPFPFCELQRLFLHYKKKL